MVPALGFAQQDPVPPAAANASAAESAAVSTAEKTVADKAAAEEAAKRKVASEQGGATSAETAKADADPGTAGQDGITVSGQEILITRNGATSKLDREMKLPNGTHVRPDGTFTTREGVSATLRPAQRLTLDGILVNASLAEPKTTQPVAVPSANASSTSAPATKTPARR